MKQMQIPSSMQININYDNPAFSANIREFRPAVYIDGEDYCVLLGEDPQAGIFGCGNTTEAALSDWDRHFVERLQTHTQNDQLVQFINDTRLTREKNVW